MNAIESHDFWRNSGFHLLDRDDAGKLIITDDFLRAYFLRPEVRPLGDSSEAEISLHEALMEDPYLAVTEQQLGILDDGDVRDNYRVLLNFRARLLESASLESCYEKIFSDGQVSVPPLLIDQLVHIILRNILDRCEDPLQLRMGEMFFRQQRASIQGGAVMMADFDVVDAHASGGAYGSVGRLIAEAQTPLKNVSLDVLERENAALYWSRDQQHDFVVRVNHGAPASVSFCRVIERWVAHFLNVSVKVRTVRAIDEDRWAWHIGLDAESTALMNDLWQGKSVDSGRLQRLVCLYRLDFDDISDMHGDIAGRAIYLALSMDPDGIVRMKPQNLLINLPVRAPG
jgi:hypothetical protein